MIFLAKRLDCYPILYDPILSIDCLLEGFAVWGLKDEDRKLFKDFVRQQLMDAHEEEIKKIKQNGKSIKLIKKQIVFYKKLRGREVKENGHKKIRVIFHLLKQLLFSEQTALKLKFWFDHFLIHSLIVIYQINLLFKI